MSFGIQTYNSFGRLTCDISSSSYDVVEMIDLILPDHSTWPYYNGVSGNRAYILNTSVNYNDGKHFSLLVYNDPMGGFFDSLTQNAQVMTYIENFKVVIDARASASTGFSNIDAFSHRIAIVRIME
jgi:hypothetical protein